MIRSLFFCTLPLAACVASAQTTETEVRAIYAKMNVCFVKHDGKGLRAIFERYATPDFVSIARGRRHGRAKAAADIEAGLTGKDIPLMKTIVVNATTKGAKLLLTVEWAISGVNAAKKPYAFKVTVFDTWVKTAKGYRYAMSAEKRA